MEKPDNLEIAKADEFETFSSSIPNYSIAFNFMEGWVIWDAEVLPHIFKTRVGVKGALPSLGQFWQPKAL